MQLPCSFAGVASHCICETTSDNEVHGKAFGQRRLCLNPETPTDI